MNLRVEKLKMVGAACLALLLFALPAAAQQEVWHVSDFTTGSVSGHKVKVLGHPAVVDSGLGGKAVQFNGADDALFFDVHPLAGAATWTWEMIFKPDADGKPEQRVFHLQSVDATTGQDYPNERMLFEIRIRQGADGKPAWCLDSFATA